jgi:hypothetical protein
MTDILSLPMRILKERIPELNVHGIPIIQANVAI